ncbi:MAG: hypothetical protein IJD21_05430 [Oscillospiraceae bacterium]|nr:hypothetical protein [Oscillospiraceae bacterium]
MKTKKKNIIVRCAADIFLPLACVFGCYVILHGHLSPGGGFQGGVLVASAILLVFLGYGHKKAKETFSEHFLHNTETLAELIYVAVAVLGVLAGFNFCINFILGGGVMETTFIMNHAVGYHVMGGILCLLIMMLGTLTEEDSSKESSSNDKEVASK